VPRGLGRGAGPRGVDRSPARGGRARRVGNPHLATEHGRKGCCERYAADIEASPELEPRIVATLTARGARLPVVSEALPRRHLGESRERARKLTAGRGGAMTTKAKAEFVLTAGGTLASGQFRLVALGRGTQGECEAMQERFARG
jgi:hypothetical protein